MEQVEVGGGKCWGEVMTEAEFRDASAGGLVIGLEEVEVGLVEGEQLLRAAEQVILQPTTMEARDASETNRVKLVEEMCKEFFLNDEQLQHIEERMVMEVSNGEKVVLLLIYFR